MSLELEPGDVVLFFFFFFFFVWFVFVFCLVTHPQHMEVPRLGVESELQLLAHTTVTATADPSRVCDLHHSSWQFRILNLPSEARDRTRNLMVPSRIRFCCAMTGTPYDVIYMKSPEYTDV